jgi:hypothetical protein
VSEEREKGPRPTEFPIVGGNGTFLTIHFGYDMDIFLEGSNSDGERTAILADFPSPINGGGRHPQTMGALQQFRSLSAPKVPKESFLITTSTKDDSSGNSLAIILDSEGNINVSIIGRSSKGVPNQTVTFTLGRLDEGFSQNLLACFVNLALAIQEDETEIQGQLCRSTSL